MRCVPWTSEQTAQLIRMRRERVMVCEISSILGISRPRIYERLRELGEPIGASAIAITNARDPRYAEILRLHALGTPSLTISRMIGVHRESVVRVLCVNGLPTIRMGVSGPKPKPQEAKPRRETRPPLPPMHPAMVEIYRAAGLPV